jgi:hypothetical protein
MYQYPYEVLKHSFSHSGTEKKKKKKKKKTLGGWLMGKRRHAGQQEGLILRGQDGKRKAQPPP